MKLNYRLLYCGVLPFIFLLGLWYQSELRLNSDVTWLLDVTAKLLAGEKYGIEIFETNPPMILALSSPVVILHKLFYWDLNFTFLLYVFLLKAVSIGFVCVFTKRIFPAEDLLLNWLLPILTTICMIFLPVYAFGQRDCLWLILVLPYIFAAVLLMQGKSKPIWQAIVVGIMAGVGFSLKPYFLPTLCLIELYVIFSKKNLFAWLRIETVIILIIFITYLLFIQLHQPGYFQVVLPLVARYYFISVSFSWEYIFTNGYVFIPALILFFYMFFYRDDRYPSFGKLIALGLIGAWCSLVLSRAIWYYHAFPSLFFSIILLIYIVVQIVRSLGGGWSNWLNISIFGSFTLIVLLPLIFSISRAMHNSIQNTAEEVANYISLQNKPKTILSFSLVSTKGTYGVVDSVNGKYFSGFPFMWWYGGILKNQINGRYPLRRLAYDREFFTQKYTGEIEKNNPHWIIVNLHNPYYFFNQANGRHEIHYMSRFMLNSGFKQAFHHYSFRKNIKGYLVYERHD